MFIPEEKIYLKNNVIIGLNNFQKSDLTIFNISLAKKIECNLKYIDIDEKILDSRIKYLREKKKTKNKKIGMISKEWLNKYQKEVPSVVIQIVDITFSTFQGKDPSLIFQDVMLIIIQDNLLKKVMKIFFILN